MRLEEDAARAREVLGNHRIEQARRDAALDDDGAEPAGRGDLRVVVEGVAIAGELGEQLDVPLADPPRAAGVVAHLRRA